MLYQKNLTLDSEKYLSLLSNDNFIILHKLEKTLLTDKNKFSDLRNISFYRNHINVLTLNALIIISTKSHNSVC